MLLSTASCAFIASLDNALHDFFPCRYNGADVFDFTITLTCVGTAPVVPVRLSCVHNAGGGTRSGLGSRVVPVRAIDLAAFLSRTVRDDDEVVFKVR